MNNRSLSKRKLKQENRTNTKNYVLLNFKEKEKFFCYLGKNKLHKRE